jgi:DNA-binding GntR family transcriptional regulator
VSDFHRLIDTMNATTPTLLYQHLADDVASMIASGTLRPGDKLPSLREMRTRRQVSLTTVTEAFRVLEDRGLIEARPQSGFYVRRRPPFRCRRKARPRPSRRWCQ